MKFSKGRGIKPKKPPFGWCGYHPKHNEKNMYVPFNISCHQNTTNQNTGKLLYISQWALTIWMEFSVIPGRIQMERFIPVENFRKKGNTFRGISLFSLLPEFPKISVPFVHSYSARLFTVIFPRKNPKGLKDGGRFPKRLSLQCEFLLVGSVGRRFRTQQQPCRWKRITFCGRYLCFSFTCMIRDTSVLPSELHRGKKCGSVLITGFSDEMWMLQ